MRRKAKIVKASTVSHAKRGYYVFSGESYPNMKAKFAKTKTMARRVKKLFDSGKRVKGAF